MIPVQDESKKWRSAPARVSPEAIFIGNHCNFSASLIAATTQEMDGIPFAVETSFHDFRSVAERGGTTPSVILMDEPIMKGLSPIDRSFLFALPGVSLGIAFCHLDFGIACLSDHELRERPVSIFPLNVRLDVWLSIVRLIAHGGSYICPEVLAAGKSDGQNGVTQQDHGLTPRQQDVLRLVAEGHSNKRIAEKLDLSIHTVKLHLHNGSMRLGARNRTEAAMRYREIGA